MDGSFHRHNNNKINLNLYLRQITNTHFRTLMATMAFFGLLRAARATALTYTARRPATAHAPSPGGNALARPRWYGGRLADAPAITRALGRLPRWRCQIARSSRGSTAAAAGWRTARSTRRRAAALLRRGGSRCYQDKPPERLAAKAAAAGGCARRSLPDGLPRGLLRPLWTGVVV